MSLYRRHAQGDVIKGEFSLTAENIDQYLDYAIKMNREQTWLTHVNNLKYKLAHLEEVDDELYTEDYLKRRLAKVMAEKETETTSDDEELYAIKERLYINNKEIDKVRPLVFDKIEGTKEENHARMSDLNDEHNMLEEQINQFYGKKYPELKEHLPKVYYMIIDGVDIDMVISCFKQMKEVLLNNLTSEQAVNTLMDESTACYNLPATIYDPIRSRAARQGKQKKGKGRRT